MTRRTDLEPPATTQNHTHQSQTVMDKSGQNWTILDAPGRKSPQFPAHNSKSSQPAPNSPAYRTVTTIFTGAPSFTFTRHAHTSESAKLMMSRLGM